MKLPIFVGMTILAAGGHAQITPASTGHGVPTFNCAANDTYGDMDSNLIWQCGPTQNTWHPLPQFVPWQTPTNGQCLQGNGHSFVTGSCGGGGSLPTATYAGQMLTATGLGTTYAASTAQCSTVITDATHICVTAPPYSASNAGATTTTVSGTFAVGTSGSVSSCSTFSANQGVLITGAGAAGVNYVGTVVSCAGTSLTVNPAISTSVANGTVVQHDETAAFQTAITALASAGGTIFTPDGLYLVNGPLQDTSGANAVLKLPSVPGYSVNIPVIAIQGFTVPTGASTSTGSVIQTSTPTGNFIGAYSATGIFPHFTNYWLSLKNLTFLFPANPGAVAINGSNILAMQLQSVSVVTPSTADPVNTAGTGIIMPAILNNVRNTVSDATVAGFYNSFIFTEHTQITTAYTAYCHNAFTFDNGTNVNNPGGYAGNTVSADYLWSLSCHNGIMAGANETAVNIQNADIESNSGFSINDASNLLHGSVNIANPYPGVGFNVNGAANLTVSGIYAGKTTYAGDQTAPDFISGNSGNGVFGKNQASAGYQILSFNGITNNSTTFLGCTGGGAADNSFYCNVPTGGQFVFLINNVGAMTLSAAKNTLGTAVPLTWGADVGLSRGASGVLDCGNSAQGDKSCLLNVGKLTTTTYTVATLPSASGSGAGAQVTVSDATSFTPGTCTGGGSDYMIAISNGTTWSCH